MLKRVYIAKKLPKIIDADLTKYYAKEFYKGVIKGFKEDILKIDWTTPDLLVIRHLEENVYQFAAAKNYQQLKDVTKALVDRDGKIRTFSQFKNEAEKVIQASNTRYMKTEYNLAICGGQASATWTRAQETKAVLPLFKFAAIIDGHTTDICINLNGVQKPIDDPFWDVWFIPNHFGERSDILQIAEGEITPDDQIIYPEKVHPLFKTNLAKHGLVFPPGHPYYEGIPDNLKEQALALMTKHDR